MIPSCFPNDLEEQKPEAYHSLYCATHSKQPLDALTLEYPNGPQWHSLLQTILCLVVSSRNPSQRNATHHSPTQHAHSSTHSHPIAPSHPSPSTCSQSPQTHQTTSRRKASVRVRCTQLSSPILYRHTLQLLQSYYSHQTDSSLQPSQSGKYPTTKHHSSIPFRHRTLQAPYTTMYHTSCFSLKSSHTAL